MRAARGEVPVLARAPLKSIKFWLVCLCVCPAVCPRAPHSSARPPPNLINPALVSPRLSSWRKWAGRAGGWVGKFVSLAGQPERRF